MNMLIRSALIDDGALSEVYASELFPVFWHPDWPNRARSETAHIQLEHPVRGLPSPSLPIELAAIRALPGHYTARLHMLGVGPSPDEIDQILPRVIAGLAAAPRIAGIETYVIAASDDIRRAYESVIARHGFAEAPLGCFPVTYRDSSLVSLTDDPETLFAKLSSRARRQIRLVEKRPVRLIRITDPAYSARIAALWAETIRRKGGAHVLQAPWSDYIEFSNKHPERSALFGLESTETDTGPENLLSFIWATRSGPFAHYEEGASADDNSARIGLAHAPMWAAIKWAHSVGAQWYDLTGVTGPNSHHVESMVGVTEFKRQFSGTELQVRSDWRLTTKPMLVGLAQNAAHAMRTTQRALHRAVGR